MIKLLLLILIPLFLLAQWTENKCGNGTFSDATGWTLAGTCAISGGTLNITADGTTNNLATYTIGSYVNDDTLKVLYGVTANTLSQQTDALYTGGVGLDIIHIVTETGTFVPAEITVASHSILCVGTGSNNLWRFRTLGAASGTISFDNLVVREQLTTIYLDVAGSDVASGEIGTPILSIAEADLRGYWNGGSIEFNEGTFTGTMDITANVTIEGSGAMVATINCGSNVVTLTGIDFTITVLTGSNITDNRTWSGEYINKFYKFYTNKNFFK